MRVFEALAEALVAEGVTSLFGLMGDGNMDVLASIRERGALATYDARHEGAALAMADGYARATGDVGVCTVTCGPGVTQLGTSLIVANRHRTPLVVVAGDTPNGEKGMGALQDLDQRRFAEASGALFHQLRGPGTVAADVQRAFFLARTQRLPVFLNCPIDVQESEAQGEFRYVGSRTRIGRLVRATPDSVGVEKAADLIANARRPVIVAGAGAIAANARDAIQTLGDRIGAALGTTVQGKGYLDGPWSFGICGTFATVKSEPILQAADLVIFVGSSVTANVTGGGSLFPRAQAIQIDVNPNALVAGRPADHLVIADAREGVEAISRVLENAGYVASGYRDGTFSEILALDPISCEIEQVDWDLPAGEVDPRRVVRELDRVLPDDCHVVIGAGHFWSFPTTYLSGRSRRFHYTYDFGCIGQAIPTGFGVAVADLQRPVVVFEGDASTLMSVHEFDTTARYRPKMLVVVMNDGALGAEVHKLRSKGHDPKWGIVRTPDFCRVAEAFGNHGATVEDASQVERIVSDFMIGEGTHVVDVRASRMAVSRYYRKNLFGAEA